MAVERAGEGAGGLDAIILTALAVEETAVVRAVGDCVVRPWQGVPMHFGQVGAHRVLVFPLGGMGNVGSAEAARHVIGVWNPAHLFLAGIAGGVRNGTDDLRLGDVIVPDQMVGYELGRVTQDGLTRRYEVYRPDPELLALARSLRSDWAVNIATSRPDDPSGRTLPASHVGPVFSGEKVIADDSGLAGLQSAWPRAIGVEMESIGVALAAYRGGQGFLMVKAISDFADSAKDGAWHEYAAEAAARFTVAVLRSVPVAAERGRAHVGAEAVSGQVKISICRRLHDDWEDVADYLDVPPHAKAGFRPGNEPRDLWEWLEARGKLHELPAALSEIGRADLAEALRVSGR